MAQLEDALSGELHMDVEERSVRKEGVGGKREGGGGKRAKRAEAQRASE